MTLYEEQEAAMINYSGRVVMTMRPLRGHINHLVINSFSSLTTDQANVPDDNNFTMFWHLMFRYLASEMGKS